MQIEELESKFPDNMEMARQELMEIDEVIDRIDILKEEKYEEILFRIGVHYDENARTAMIIRCLENRGKNNLPEDEVTMAMFDLIENSLVIFLEMIDSEKINI